MNTNARDASPGRNSATATWRPLLSGPAAQRALRTVDVLAASIAAMSTAEQDPSVAGGQAGLALLHASVAKAQGTGGGSHASRCLDQAIETVATEATEYGLYHGVTGVAWVAELVDRLLDPGGEDRNEAADDALMQLLARPELWPAPHDLILGATGVGVYALERHPRPSAVTCLRLVLDRLEESALHDPQGAYWWTPQAELGPGHREEFPNGVADLGVAHGVPAAIAFLGALCAIGVEETRARPLLQGAVDWLLAQAIPSDAGPTYPVWLAPGVKPEPARSAWCYGDPGVAATLLVAARGAGEPAWEREAVALACRAAARLEEETGVEDAALCHGSSGLAHLYNRLYQATGEAALGQASRYWLERTLELCRAPDEIDGSWMESGGHPDRSWFGPGLLYGAAGIALVLLAAATPVEPVWDRALLVSAPGVPLGHDR